MVRALQTAATPPLSSGGTRELMGKGREIGAQLHGWLARHDRGPLQARHLEGLLLDALGGDARLRGPVRDLALQPLLQQLLQEPSPGVRRSLLDTLAQDLAATYAPAVLNELLDLLEEATGLPVAGRSAGFTAPGSSAPAEGGGPPAASPDGEPAGRDRSRHHPSRLRRGRARSGGALRQRPTAAAALQTLGPELLPLAPGLALAFANALVFLWLGGELGRLLPLDWSSGLLLLLVLASLQVLMLRPLARLRRAAPLRLQDSGDPHRVWRWITAPWVHHRQGEALVNGAMLLILLGETPLPLGQLLLRYLLTSLATMAGAVLLARRWLRAGVWDGATGAVAALIALATGASLLHWRPLSFPFGVLSVPSWVLFLVYGAIQMGWVLPRQVHDDEESTPLQRLLCSSWWWGTALGLAWALLTRLQDWLEPLLRAGGGQG